MHFPLLSYCCNIFPLISEVSTEYNCCCSLCVCNIHTLMAILSDYACDTPQEINISAVWHRDQHNTTLTCPQTHWATHPPASQYNIIMRLFTYRKHVWLLYYRNYRRVCLILRTGWQRVVTQLSTKCLLGSIMSTWAARAETSSNQVSSQFQYFLRSTQFS